MLYVEDSIFSIYDHKNLKKLDIYCNVSCACLPSGNVNHIA
jgi:hypothetical protein